MSQSVNELMNNKGVCRIAPATPGLLNVYKFAYLSKLLGITKTAVHSTLLKIYFDIPPFTQC